jgi:hypothetical protein
MIEHFLSPKLHASRNRQEKLPIKALRPEPQSIPSTKVGPTSLAQIISLREKNVEALTSTTFAGALRDDLDESPEISLVVANESFLCDKNPSKNAIKVVNQYPAADEATKSMPRNGVDHQNTNARDLSTIPVEFLSIIENSLNYSVSDASLLGQNTLRSVSLGSSKQMTTSIPDVPGPAQAAFDALPQRQPCQDVSSRYLNMHKESKKGPINAGDTPTGPLPQRPKASLAKLNNTALWKEAKKSANMMPTKDSTAWKNPSGLRRPLPENKPHIIATSRPVCEKETSIRNVEEPASRIKVKERSYTKQRELVIDSKEVDEAIQLLSNLKRILNSSRASMVLLFPLAITLE